MPTEIRMVPAPIPAPASSCSFSCLWVVEAGWITRLFDRWLARRIDFPKLDRNHRLLKVGPHQIQAEIVRSSRRAGELEAITDEAEQRAAVSEGLPEVLDEMSEALARETEATSSLGVW